MGTQFYNFWSVFADWEPENTHVFQTQRNDLPETRQERSLRAIARARGYSVALEELQIRVKTERIDEGNDGFRSSLHVSQAAATKANLKPSQEPHTPPWSFVLLKRSLREGHADAAEPGAEDGVHSRRRLPHLTLGE